MAVYMYGSIYVCNNLDLRYQYFIIFKIDANSGHEIDIAYYDIR